jgi:hypothetical protein
MLALGIPQTCITPHSSAEARHRRFSIRPKSGDTVWRVRLDDGWFRDQTTKKIDFMFWTQSAAGRRRILLVELKGKNFGAALEQLNSTLEHLCKLSANQGIHTGNHRASPGHDAVSQQAIRAYVVLSKGKGVPLRTTERERIRKRYGILIYTHEQRIEIDGLDTLTPTPSHAL